MFYNAYNALCFIMAYNDDRGSVGVEHRCYDPESPCPNSNPGMNANSCHNSYTR